MSLKRNNDFEIARAIEKIRTAVYFENIPGEKALTSKETAWRMLSRLLENVDVDELLTHQEPEVRKVGLSLKERLDKFEKTRKVFNKTPRTSLQLSDAYIDECLPYVGVFDDLDRED